MVLAHFSTLLFLEFGYTRNLISPIRASKKKSANQRAVGPLSARSLQLLVTHFSLFRAFLLFFQKKE